MLHTNTKQNYINIIYIIIVNLSCQIEIAAPPHRGHTLSKVIFLYIFSLFNYIKYIKTTTTVYSTKAALFQSCFSTALEHLLPSVVKGWMRLHVAVSEASIKLYIKLLLYIRSQKPHMLLSGLRPRLDTHLKHDSLTYRQRVYTNTAYISILVVRVSVHPCFSNVVARTCEMTRFPVQTNAA